MKEGCGNNCRKGCKAVMDTEKRKSIFEKFWNMSDYNRQSSFVCSFIKRVPKKRMANIENSRKKSNISYYLPLESTDRAEVCK